MTRRSLALAAVVAALAACASEKVAPLVTSRTSTARTLGIVALEHPEEPRSQALLALELDARRRAARFREINEPGFLFATTRVPQAEIDAGLWSARELYELGAQLFTQRFRKAEGYGGADTPPFGRFQRGERGGPDGEQCSDCHRRGGLAGAGDASDNAYPYGDGEAPDRGLERNPIALSGGGLLEILAREMSNELASQREALFQTAKQTGAPAKGKLTSKGLSFGALTARPNGTVDATEVEGVAPDLVVRPFGWKGHTATLREMVESELATHHGMQSEWFVAHANVAAKGSGPELDPDGDGVTGEISEGQVTALVAFLAMQEVPIAEPPVMLKELGSPNIELMPRWLDGAARFRSIGCDTCHVPELPLGSATFTLMHRGGGAPFTIDLARDGATPRIAIDDNGQLPVRAFTDLKRHDMGAALADAFDERGVAPSVFLTPPLWGVARSRPYLHDGRAPTLEAAILMHGGEAQASRDAYEKLDEHDRGGIRVFLTSLNRQRRFATP